MIQEKYKKIGFDQNLEESFLSGLDNFEIRKKVLESEIATAIHETFLHKFENGYFFEDGKIIDKTTKSPLENMILNCGRLPETEAFLKIQNELDKNTELVVHFSPKNEEYDYPMDCVDFWWKNAVEVRWMRVVVNNNFDNLNSIYKDITGSKVGSVMEMLSKPVGLNNMKIGEVLLMLDTMEEINSITSDEIRESVKVLMEGFLEKFDKEIVENPEVIFRLFSAAMAEAKKINKYKERSLRVDLDREEMMMYLNAEMETKTMSTFGCASSNNVGEFNKYIIIRNNDGSFKISRGEAPEGYKYCEHCGMYYDGEKCPVCN